MTTSELSIRLARTWRILARPSVCNRCLNARPRHLATIVDAPIDNDLESTSFDVPAPKPGEVKFDPLAASRGQASTTAKQIPIPPSKTRPRPVTPPSTSQTLRSSVTPLRPRSFLLPSHRTNLPQHRRPRLHDPLLPAHTSGLPPISKSPRLRSWEGPNPYFANRQLRGPRGGDVLRLLRRPITFRNVPMIERITVHTFVRGAVHTGSSYLHVAGMVLQAITSARVQIHESRHGEQGWGLVRGKPVAATATLKGEDMYHFLGKLVNVVLPRIKDWKGVRATTGDSSGNLSFGLEPEVVGAFPEIEVNYDSYPPKMIPGLHIHVHTTAPVDKDARLLLMQLGVPFYGKVVD